MASDPRIDVNFDAMLPELRKGLRTAAERRVRQEHPNWTAWELLGIGATICGMVVGIMAGPAMIRGLGCGTALLSLLSVIAMSIWWRHQVRQGMRDVLLDPRRCMKCGYPLVGLDGPNCPECGEPFLYPVRSGFT